MSFFFFHSHFSIFDVFVILLSLDDLQKLNWDDLLPSKNIGDNRIGENEFVFWRVNFGKWSITKMHIRLMETTFHFRKTSYICAIIRYCDHMASFRNEANESGSRFESVCDIL